MLTRRDLGTLCFFGLATALHARAAAALRPFGPRWIADLDALGREVKGQSLGQVEWMAKVEELLGRVDVDDFLRLIDFDAILKKGEAYGGKGAKSLAVEFPERDGIPDRTVFGRQIFAVKKGRSVVPHGHDNMATAFLVIKGEFRGRLYERLEDGPKHLILRPSIDRAFARGSTSSISDKKDNVHWFEATTDSAYIFNIHVTGVTPQHPRPTGRVYVDPAGEALEGGRIRARIINHAEADRLYG